MPRLEQGNIAEAIRGAAAELFFKQGYEATTLRQVSAKVGIQVGSLYNHINSKEELLTGIMTEIMDDLLEAIREVVDRQEPAVIALRAAIDCHIRFHAHRARDVFIGNSELRSLSAPQLSLVMKKRDEYEAVIRDLVARVAQEENVDVLNIRLQTYAILALGAHVSSWFKPGGPMSLDAIVAIYGDMIFRQLGLGSLGPSENR